MTNKAHSGDKQDQKNNGNSSREKPVHRGLESADDELQRNISAKGGTLQDEKTDEDRAAEASKEAKKNKGSGIPDSKAGKSKFSGRVDRSGSGTGNSSGSTER